MKQARNYVLLALGLSCILPPSKAEFRTQTPAVCQTELAQEKITTVFKLPIQTVPGIINRDEVQLRIEDANNMRILVVQQLKGRELDRVNLDRQGMPELGDIQALGVLAYQYIGTRPDELAVRSEILDGGLIRFERPLVYLIAEKGVHYYGFTYRGELREVNLDTTADKKLNIVDSEVGGRATILDMRPINRP